MSFADILREAAPLVKLIAIASTTEEVQAMAVVMARGLHILGKIRELMFYLHFVEGGCFGPSPLIVAFTAATCTLVVRFGRFLVGAGGMFWNHQGGQNKPPPLRSSLLVGIEVVRRLGIVLMCRWLTTVGWRHLLITACSGEVYLL